jgi:cytosine/adenosine deaminase-related metal-dependent hydrolase
MRWAGGATRAVDGPSAAVDARGLFGAATLGGARALGRGDIGRLQPGAKADIVCVDFTGLHVGPVDDPIETLVSRCYGPDVDRVVVDGRDVVTDGSCVAADGSTLRRDAQETLAAIERTFVEWAPAGESAEDLFPPSFETREPPEHSSPQEDR